MAELFVAELLVAELFDKFLWPGFLFRFNRFRCAKDVIFHKIVLKRDIRYGGESDCRFDTAK